MPVLITSKDHPSYQYSAEQAYLHLHFYTLTLSASSCVTTLQPHSVLVIKLIPPSVSLSQKDTYLVPIRSAFTSRRKLLNIWGSECWKYLPSISAYSIELHPTLIVSTLSAWTHSMALSYRLSPKDSFTKATATPCSCLQAGGEGGGRERERLTHGKGCFQQSPVINLDTFREVGIFLC